MEQTALRRLVADIFGAAVPAGAPISTHEIDELLLVAGWLRKFPLGLARARRVA